MDSASRATDTGSVKPRLMDQQIIFIVGGSTGEYSNRSEWTSRAFMRREDAEAFVAFLTARRQQLSPQGDHLNWDARDAVEKAMQVFDPGYSEDYTGTSWWVAETPLHSGPFSDPSPPTERDE